MTTNNACRTSAIDHSTTIGTAFAFTDSNPIRTGVGNFIDGYYIIACSAEPAIPSAARPSIQATAVTTLASFGSQDTDAASKPL